MACPDAHVSKLAMQAILRYKEKSLAPYADTLLALAGGEEFRESLTNFDMEKVDSSHRSGVVEAVTRILFGKLNSRAGKKR